MKHLIVIAATGLALALAVASTGGAGTGARSDQSQKVDDLTLELVGQVSNSAPAVTPATSIQYGYIAYLRGLPIFKSEPQNESTALFTFYVDTTTTRVISNGPLRILSRKGTMTIYRDPSTANGSFANPDSFRDGTPILVAGLRQQVIVDTSTGAFSALNLNTTISSSPFSTGSGELQLGEKGLRFRTVISGHASTTAPPSAYMAGYTVIDPQTKKQG
jgi:hypothetical protein